MVGANNLGRGQGVGVLYGSGYYLINTTCPIWEEEGAADEDEVGGGTKQNNYVINCYPFILPDIEGSIKEAGGG